MSDDSSRATVATVDAKLDGLAKLIDMGFRDMQRQLDAVRDLPGDVRALRADHDGLRQRVDDRSTLADHEALERRVEDLEKQREGRGQWKRSDLPLLLLTGAWLLTAIVFGVLQVMQHA